MMLFQFPIELGTFTATFEFCVWVRVGIDVYILHRNTGSNLIHTDSFQLFVMLPYLIGINSFVCNDKINLMSKFK